MGLSAPAPCVYLEPFGHVGRRFWAVRPFRCLPIPRGAWAASRKPRYCSLFPRREPRLRLGGLRRTLRSHLRVAFWGWRRGSGDVADRDRLGRGSPGPMPGTWQSGTGRGELAVDVEAFDLLHYMPPDGRLYHSLDELGGWEPRPGRRTNSYAGSGVWTLYRSSSQRVGGWESSSSQWFPGPAAILESTLEDLLG
jgi:hypothetical protein